MTKKVVLDLIGFWFSRVIIGDFFLCILNGFTNGIVMFFFLVFSNKNMLKIEFLRSHNSDLNILTIKNHQKINQ
jgi:hypothetical protein